MSQTLEILRRSHRALLDYEAEREARQGPRSEASRAALRKVVEAHRESWSRAGGKPEDFLLGPLLGEGSALDAKAEAEKVLSEPASVEPEERPRGKSKKPALNSGEGEA